MNVSNNNIFTTCLIMIISFFFFFEVLFPLFCFDLVFYEEFIFQPIRLFGFLSLVVEWISIQALSVSIDWFFFESLWISKCFSVLGSLFIELNSTHLVGISLSPFDIFSFIHIGESFKYIGSIRMLLENSHHFFAIVN